MGVNSKAKDPDAALWWTTRFVSVDLPTVRRRGSPAVATRCRRSRALEDVVTEGNLPEHAAYFNEVAKVGYAIPPAIATKPEVAANINSEIDKVVKSGADAQEFATKICAKFINGG